MILEFHVLQNLAPSNINRDDLGSPKEAMFGGYRRARVSSQSWKRAVREAFAQDDLVPEERRSDRTKRLMIELQGKLVNAGKPEDISLQVARALLQGMGITQDSKSPDEEPLTQYLVFVGNDETERLAQVALDHWDKLSTEVKKAEAGSKKKDLKAAVPKEVTEATLDALNGSKAADLALFGRMLADLPARNVDGAAQVAHAISTHTVDIEFDFYTAVDDLNRQEDTGAGMMGEVGYDSATLYRYTNVDLNQLATNLGGDAELVNSTIAAYARAFLTSIPTGKQNSFAAQNPPSFALAVVRDSGRWSLANAFIDPVRTGRGNIMDESIRKLSGHWADLTTMYGADGIAGTISLSLSAHAEALESAGFSQASFLTEWIDAITNAAQGGSHHG